MQHIQRFEQTLSKVANYSIQNMLKGRITGNLIFVHVVLEPVQCNATVLTFQLILVGYRARANRIKVTSSSEHVNVLGIQFRKLYALCVQFLHYASVC
jgi:hypothetical protein